jgi:hypothetical protein
MKTNHGGDKVKAYLRKVVFSAALVLLLALVAPGITASNTGDYISAPDGSISNIQSDPDSSYTDPMTNIESEPSETMTQPDDAMIDGEKSQEGPTEVIPPDMFEEDVTPETQDSSEPEKGWAKGKGFSNGLFKKSK